MGRGPKSPAPLAILRQVETSACHRRWQNRALPKGCSRFTSFLILVWGLAAGAPAQVQGSHEPPVIRRISCQTIFTVRVSRSRTEIWKQCRVGRQASILFPFEQVETGSLQWAASGRIIWLRRGIIDGMSTARCPLRRSGVSKFLTKRWHCVRRGVLSGRPRRGAAAARGAAAGERCAKVPGAGDWVCCAGMRDVFVRFFYTFFCSFICPFKIP